MHTHWVVSHCVILFEKGFGALGTEKHVKLSGFKKAESSEQREENWKQMRKQYGGILKKRWFTKLRMTQTTILIGWE